jgi:hypothetical protein
VKLALHYSYVFRAWCLSKDWDSYVSR